MARSSITHPITQALLAARQSGTPWQPERMDETLSLDDAYAIQAEVAQALGWFEGRPQAWKVGGLPMLNAAPLPEVLVTPAVWPLAGQMSVIVEAEVAFRLGRTPESAQDVLACLSTVCVAIEIVSTRLVGGLSAPPVWKLLDQGLHAGLVIGAEQPYSVASSTLPAWSAQHCQITINGQVAAQAVGTHPSGDPLIALPWLFEHAARFTGGLRAGDLVTTGAWLLQTVVAGDTVEVEFEGLGAVRLALSTV